MQNPFQTSLGAPSTGPALLPPIAPLIELVGVLQAGGIALALGGSGLLHAMGLANQVRDWDLTTDESPERLKPLVAIFSHEVVLPNGPFHTELMFRIRHGPASIDLMSRFALAGNEGASCPLPTVPRGEWNSIPLCAAEVWLVAYRLLERSDKANLLATHFVHNACDDALIAHMLQFALPDTVRIELESLRSNAGHNVPNPAPPAGLVANTSGERPSSLS